MSVMFLPFLSLCNYRMSVLERVLTPHSHRVREGPLMDGVGGHLRLGGST
jgi:hypothetical protein